MDSDFVASENTDGAGTCNPQTPPYRSGAQHGRMHCAPALPGSAGLLRRTFSSDAGFSSSCSEVRLTASVFSRANHSRAYASANSAAVTWRQTLDLARHLVARCTQILLTDYRAE